MTKRFVLIPLDGSDFSRQILSELIKFIPPDGNELILLRVAQPPTGITGRPTRPATAEIPIPMYESVRELEYARHPVYASQAWESLLAVIQDEWQADVTRLQAMGYTVQSALRFGNPAEEIVAFVEEQDIDLVAMTTHGRWGLGRLVLGSVAGQVLRHVSVPVMLLRVVEEPALERVSAGVLAPRR